MSAAGRRNADDLLAALVAAGRTHAEAAAEAGVSERTVARRAKEPAFARRVQDLRSEMTARALGRMADRMAEAADALHQLLGAKAEAVRLGAARSILELGVRLRESVELEERIRRLEQQQQGGGEEG